MKVVCIFLSQLGCEGPLQRECAERLLLAASGDPLSHHCPLAAYEDFQQLGTGSNPQGTKSPPSEGRLRALGIQEGPPKIPGISFQALCFGWALPKVRFGPWPVWGTSHLAPFAVPFAPPKKNPGDFPSWRKPGAVGLSKRQRCSRRNGPSAYMAGLLWRSLQNVRDVPRHQNSASFRKELKLLPT